MNKLWLRLSLAFGGVVLVAVLIVVVTGILVGRANRPENFRPEFLLTPRGFVEELATYYQRHQSWLGVEPLLTGAQATFRVERGGDLAFFLANAEENVIYHFQANMVGRPLRRVEHTQILPIRVGDQTVGYLGIAPVTADRRFRRGAATMFPLELLARQLLTIAVIGGVVGILFGVLVSRTLTAPLSRLAEAARAIGTRNLSQRVEVTGSDEMIEVAQAFNDMASTLEQTEQLRRNLIADVAHELRTPLTVLQGNLRAMLDDVYSLDKSEVARLYDQTRLLSRLVNDLHELAQAEARQLPLDLQNTDLTQLVSKATETFRPGADEKGVTLHTELPVDLPQLRLDPARITQVIQNLLANALRHTPAGGTITIRAEPEPEAVRLAIADTGDGIPATHLPHIFDRFYRTDPARSRDRGGAGLGLAIARAIIEAHGGQISATSDGLPGHGSTFTIRLPYRSTVKDLKLH
jgi:two-component system OmpR family sensor kinase